LAPDTAGAGANPAHLAVHDLSIRYGGFEAVHNVDLHVATGEIVSVIGANGAGKSSLLNAVMGAAAISSGSILWDGAEISKRRTADILASGIALVPEGRRLFASLTVEENLDIGEQAGRRGPIDVERVFAWFPVLKERRKQRAGQLSGGQQQMIALGRALLANPRLLLCDEISLGLAPTVINDLYRLVPELRAAGLGIVLVEQDITRSLAVADRFYCMLEGRITLEGDPRRVSRETVMAHYFGADHSSRAPRQ
jgi:branched-chain amino acid transport system ATP-binding protein